MGCKIHTRVGSVKNNVCKTLQKKTVIYAVFVDSDETHPWTDYDINSTLDSIQTAIKWMENQARANGVPLQIDLYNGLNVKKGKVIPFKQELKFKTLSGTLFHYMDIRKGIKLLDKWSDKISKDVTQSIPGDTSKMILTANKSNNRERLIAKLRNKYKTDNIALLFFINNYFENEISVALHTSSDDKTEYAIVSEKNPAVITHEFLHLFGAWDLYMSPFDKNIFAKNRKRKAMKKYPDEIMAFTHKRIDSLNLSPLTKYLIGWHNKLEKGAGNMFFRRRWKLLEY